MIRLDRLEAQLVAGLMERVSKPAVIEYALRRFQEQLQKRLRDLQEQTLKAVDAVDAVKDLQSQRHELKAQGSKSRPGHCQDGAFGNPTPTAGGNRVRNWAAR
jgi:hypothetical protein